MLKKFKIVRHFQKYVFLKQALFTLAIPVAIAGIYY